MNTYHKIATEPGGAEGTASTEANTVRPAPQLPPKPLPAETIRRIREEVAEHRRESSTPA